MRRAVILSVVLSLWFPFFRADVAAHAIRQAPSAAADKIAPQLRATLNALQTGEMISVIVTLGDQADLTKIGGADRAARLKGVVRALQAKADASQRALRALLDTRRSQGRVGRVISLWALNGLSVSATQDVIQELAADRKSVV